MKKIFSILICLITLLSVVCGFCACDSNSNNTPNDNCIHTWALKQATQQKTIYECSKCNEPKEFNLSFDKNYIYTETQIEIPQGLSLEQLIQTLPTNIMSVIPLEIREQVGTIDTVDEFKLIIKEAIKTGKLNAHFDDIIISVANVIERISVSDNSQTYILKVKLIGQDEESIEISKTENTTQLLALSEYQELRFIDGKIQYVITYLKDIKIIFNFENN